MFGNPRQVRKRSTSSSGLTPGSSLRNTLSTIVSSNTTDEFDCSTPIRRTAVSSDSRGSAPSNWWKLKCPSEVVISSVASIRRSNSIASGRLGERVVHGPFGAVRDRLPARRPVRVRGTEGQRQLVELMRAGGEAGLDECEQQQRVLAQRDALDDVDPGDGARLGRVPALLLDPVAELLLVDGAADLLGGDLDALTHRRAASASTSWNQKKPRGPSVSR